MMNKYWYGKPSLLSYLLSPFSWLFRAIVWMRKRAYQVGLLRTTRVSVPVLIVGNITVGGTGKTPLVIALANQFTQTGLLVGIISRGYRSRARYPCWVTPQSNVLEVGDEPLLIAQKTQCPMVIDKNRVRAAQTLLSKFPCHLLISDDGLQHYALARDCELAVIDGTRRFGNGLCLPAGPLREPPSRLDSVDFKIVQGAEPQNGEWEIVLQAGQLVNIQDPKLIKPLSFLRGETVHAYAGIGHPERFFAELRRLGCHVIEHAQPDHAAYSPDDIVGELVIMTEKDAVKCRSFAKANWWTVPVSVQLKPQLVKALTDHLLNR